MAPMPAWIRRPWPAFWCGWLPTLDHVSHRCHSGSTHDGVALRARSAPPLLPVSIFIDVVENGSEDVQKQKYRLKPLGPFQEENSVLLVYWLMRSGSAL